MTVIFEAKDPVSVLEPPPAANPGEYLKSIRSNAGYVLQAGDWAARKVFNYSPIESVVEPFAGDWTQLYVAKGGWERMSVALDAVAENYRVGNAQLAQAWQGEAAAAARIRIDDIADLHSSQARGAAIIAEQADALAEVSQSAGQVLATGLSVLSDILMEVMIELATPIAGQIVGAARAPFLASKFYRVVTKILRAIQKILAVIEKVVRIIATVQKAIAAAKALMSAATTMTRIDSGFLVDDVARTQFGVG